MFLHLIGITPVVFRPNNESAWPSEVPGGSFDLNLGRGSSSDDELIKSCASFVLNRLGCVVQCLNCDLQFTRLGIDHSYLPVYFQNKSKHFKVLQVVPEDKRLFLLLLRLVRQPRAILGAPHHIC